MSLKARLTDDMKTAMKAGEKDRLGVIRLVLAAIKQKEVDERVEMTDPLVLAVLEKMVKQRKDSITQYESAAREDLAAIERYELGVIQAYLPEKMDEAAILAAIDQAMAQTGAATGADIGKLMGVLKPALAGFAARGLVGLAIYDSGPRCFYNTRRPIVEPRDLHGMKIRVPVSDIFIRMLRLFGANPTPLSLGEVFSGMETHMIEGAENNIRSFQSSRHFEAARYWSKSEHAYAPDVLLMSRRSFDALAPRDRGLLLELARASVPVMRAEWDESEALARRTVAGSGVLANDCDIPAFRRAAQPLLDAYQRDPAIADLTRRIRALA